MDDSSDMEEVEDCRYKNNGSDIDPDIAFSYLDEKIQAVLGHFQKDFGSGDSAGKFGIKFNDYGSFLPMYLRAPSIRSHTINRQSDCNGARLANNLPSKHFIQNLKAPPPGRPAAINCNDISSLNTREPSGCISGRIDSRLPSAEVTGSYPQKDETLSSSINLIKSRSLKVRIRAGTGGTAATAQKTAEIYSGLGLDDSPISSSENSTPMFQGSMAMSATKIIQEMTSFQVPGGALISPLHDSLLCLSRKEKSFGEIKSVLSLEDRVVFPKPVNETTAMQNKGKLVKEKKKEIRHRERQVILKNEIDTCLDKQKTVLIDGKSKNECFDGKDFLHSELKCKPVSNSIHDFGGSSLHSKEDRVNGRFKESYSESISGQDCLKSNKQETKDEKAGKQKAKNSGNYVVDNLGDDRKYKGVKAPTSVVHPIKIAKCNDYLDPQINKLCPNATLHEKGKDTLSSKTEQPGITGKNRVKRLQNTGGRSSGSFEEGFKIGSEALEARNDTNCGTHECESKRRSSILHNNKKVRERNRGFSNSTGLDQKCNSKDIIDWASGDMRKVKGLNDSGVEKIKFRNKPKLNGGKVNIHLMNGSSVEDGQCASPIVVNTHPASKVESSVVALEDVTTDNWVCCDSCQKWRLLPFGTKSEQLPEKWVCGMLDWLPGMNRCDISEEETTNKLTALYQLRFSESAHALQNHANGPTSNDASADNHYLDQYLGLETTSNQGKKKDSLKQTKNSGCSVGEFHVKSSLKKENHQQESRKNKSLNGLSHPPNQLRNSMGSVTKLHDSVDGKNRPKLKAKFMDRDNCKQIKRKAKRPMENDLCPVDVKKSKAESMCSADIHQDFDANFEKLGYCSNSCLSNMEGGEEDMLEYDEICLSKNDKCNMKDKIQVSLKMRGKQDQVRGKSDNCTKKRKLKDWQGDDQNCHTSAIHGRMHAKEEICERFKKEKKPRVSKTKGEDSSKSNRVDDLERRGRTTPTSMSGTGNGFVKGEEEMRNSGKDRELQMKTKKIFSEQTSIAKANVEVKGSSAESVSSFPLRTSSLDQIGGDKEITSYIQEKIPFASEPLQVSQRGGNHHRLSVDAPKSNGQSNSKTGNENGINHGLQTPDQQGCRDLNASSLDTSKEAKDFKDYADHRKTSDFGLESNEARFQFALKFLHEAFQLETFNNANSRHGDKTQIQFYGTTAELCEICASEYVRRQEMAAAALAYKCIEVAYMRVIYYKHSSTNGDWNEMFSSLRTVVQGESPSSTVSDVDNLSNLSTIYKAIYDKDGSFVAGSDIFNAGQRMIIAQLLDSTQNINLAMEASKKSRAAFLSASVDVRKAKNAECLASVKKVIDFSFQDVEEFIRLVRLAVEAMNRSGLGSARD